jgi:hypothetical protein
MKIIDKWRERKKLEKMVTTRLEELLEVAETPEEVAAVLALKEQANQAKKKSWISPDTVVLAACNLLGILLILNFEKIDVVSSKALGFVTRPKI